MSENLFAQPINWSPVPIPDPAYNPRSLYYSENFDFTVYGGLFRDSPGHYYLAAYNGENWETLVDTVQGDVWCATDYQEGILVGGYAVSAHQGADLDMLGYYDGVNWTYPWQFNAAVKNLVWTNDTLFALGDFTEIDGEPIYKVAKLVNGIWQPVLLNSELDLDFSFFNDIEFYDGYYYIGGNFQTETGPQDLARIDDMQLHQVGSGLVGSWVMVADLQVYNGELYVTGKIPYAQGNVGNMIVRWDGEQLSSVGQLAHYYQDTFGIYGGMGKMYARNGYLYVSGSFGFVGDTSFNGIARWDGEQWCSLWGESFNFGNFEDNPITAFGWFQDQLMLMRYYQYDDGSYDGFWIYEGGDEVSACTEPLAVETIDNEAHPLKVYPNPVMIGSSETPLHVICKNSILEIELYDITGKTMLNRAISGDLKTVDVVIPNNISTSGVYIIQVSTKQGIYQQKIVLHD